jgi:hypothetical protein
MTSLAILLEHRQNVFVERHGRGEGDGSKAGEGGEV